MDKHKDGNAMDRRGFLECMQWAGAGVVWSFAAGVPTSQLLEAAPKEKLSDFSFVQISDTHIGFGKPANPNVTATLHEAVEKINALPHQPDLIIHTGDLTHLSKAEEFDTLDQSLKQLRSRELVTVPGEHDVMGDDGKRYRETFGKGSLGAGWRSFDHKGVHFVGLNNCAQMEGLGSIGGEQMKWLGQDLKRLPSSTPIVVFAHIPLWSVYPEWGWATKDSEEALGMVRRFGSVTVLNGHIHQVMQKVEGKVMFHSARSTAFPQPAPGSAPAAGPMKVPDEKLRQVLGICEVSVTRGQHALAVVDSALA